MLSAFSYMSSTERKVYNMFRSCFVETLRSVEGKVSADGEEAYPFYLPRTRPVEVWEMCDKRFNVSESCVYRETASEWKVIVPVKNLDCKCCAKGVREDGKNYCAGCCDNRHVIDFVLRNGVCPYSSKNPVTPAPPSALDWVPTDLLHGVSCYMLGLSDNEVLDLDALKRDFESAFSLKHSVKDRLTMVIAFEYDLPGVDWDVNWGPGEDDNEALLLPVRRL